MMTATEKPMPRTVADAAIELAGLRKTIAGRRAAAAAYKPSAPLLARVEALERMLANEPALALEDVRARLWWMRRQEREGAVASPEARVAFLDRLRADLDEIERASR